MQPHQLVKLYDPASPHDQRVGRLFVQDAEAYRAAVQFPGEPEAVLVRLSGLDAEPEDRPAWNVDDLASLISAHMPVAEQARLVRDLFTYNPAVWWQLLKLEDAE